MRDQILSPWMQTLIDYVRSGRPDLTNRQMALLMLVYITPGPHTVRGIAKKLSVSKPVVTRALNRLGSLGYLRRERDQADREHTDRSPVCLEVDQGAADGCGIQQRRQQPQQDQLGIQPDRWHEREEAAGDSDHGEQQRCVQATPTGEPGEEGDGGNQGQHRDSDIHPVILAGVP